VAAPARPGIPEVDGPMGEHAGMRLLVTGGAGFIGSNLVDRLIGEGAEVTAVDNFDPFYPRARKLANLRRASAYPGFRLEEVDIRDAVRVGEVVRSTRPDVIVHLAARAGVRPSIDEPALYTAVNVQGTVHLLEAACRLDPKPKFVYASSSSVYGDRPDAPFRETDPVDHPVSPYAATKKACELLAYTFHHLHGLPVTGLRFFTAYGPRNRPDLAIAKFASLIERGEPVPMFGDGTTRRDYTFVDDIVDGVVRAVDRCSTHHLYNLGNSHPVELRAMIEAIGEALGKTPRIKTLPEQPGDVRQTYADVSRASAELGYSPRTPFREGLKRYVAWFREEADWTSL
jgi:UDP-glucuronate 4-epimerase